MFQSKDSIIADAVTVGEAIPVIGSIDSGVTTTPVVESSVLTEVVEGGETTVVETVSSEKKSPLDGLDAETELCMEVNIKKILNINITKQISLISLDVLVKDTSDQLEVYLF